MKSVLASMLKQRLLGVKGWYSTNVLGNSDGLRLQNSDALGAKQQSKSTSVDEILNGELYPELYSDIFHDVHISYSSPWGDNKEAWDSIHIAGWMGQSMQLKVNMLCRDSILAAPLVLDLALLLDLAKINDSTNPNSHPEFFPITKTRA